MKVLITGGAGFIGSNFIHYLLELRPEWEIINFDSLTYAGNLKNLESIESEKQYSFIKGDITDLTAIKNVFSKKIDFVVNFAAETHVDRSLYDPGLFLKTNVLGTGNLLWAAKENGIKRFLQISSDEVYGPVEAVEARDESGKLNPTSAYAASKASADLLCLTYYKTSKLPVIITRSSNNYGPFQFPEKIIPFFITRALKDQALPLYGDGLFYRSWLHVRDNCAGILEALEKGKDGEIYNIGGNVEITNLDLTKKILGILSKSENLIKPVQDRPSHDRRYAIDCSKIRNELGWLPKIGFETGLKATIEWYLENEPWWHDILSGEYRKFFDLHYKNRLNQTSI